MTTNLDLDKMAFRFFKTFAQYEYALKVLGYVSAGPRKQAEPNWDKFSNEVGGLIMDSSNEKTTKAINYIQNHPPKRQVLEDEGISWENVSSSDKSPQMLFSHIRRIRNNLYHGGKFHSRWIAPDRSKELIESALIILEALQKEHAELSEAIQGNRA